MRLRKEKAQKNTKELTQIEKFQPFLFKENIQLEGRELEGIYTPIPITFEKIMKIKYIQQTHQKNLVFDVMPLTEIMLPPKSDIFYVSEENPKQLIIDVNMIATLETCPNLLNFEDRPLSWYYAAVFKSEILQLDFVLPEQQKQVYEDNLFKLHLRRLKHLVTTGNRKLKEENISGYFEAYVLFGGQFDVRVQVRDVALGFSHVTFSSPKMTGRVWWFVDYQPRPVWSNAAIIKKMPSTKLRTLIAHRLEMSIRAKMTAQGQDPHGRQMVGIINPYLNRVNVFRILNIPTQEDLEEIQIIIDHLNKNTPILSRQCIECEFREQCYNEKRSFTKIQEVR